MLETAIGNALSPVADSRVGGTISAGLMNELLFTIIYGRT